MSNTTTDALPTVAWMWQHGETGNTGFVQDAPDDELAHWERMNRPRVMVARLVHHDAAIAIIERLTAERDALRDVIDGTLAQAVARLEKCEAERDAALEEIERLKSDVADLLAACNELAQPAQAQPSVTLTASQLREALLFVAGDGGPLDEDQSETQVTIAWKEVMRGDGTRLPPGYVAWLTDYPEEGGQPLDGSVAQTPAQPEWREWHGGPCPVHPDSRVNYRLRSRPFDNGSFGIAGKLKWDHIDFGSDIISWRPTQPSTAEAAKAVERVMKIVDGCYMVPGQRAALRSAVEALAKGER